MSLKRTKRFAAALAVLTFAVFATGCGKTDPTPVAGATGYNYGGVPNPYGGPTGQCFPISGPILFTGQNIYFDSANIVGGIVPYSSGQATGQMYVGGNAMSGGPFQRSGVDGMISMSVMAPGTTYPGSSPYGVYPQYSYPVPQQYQQYSQPGYQTKIANVTGVVQISPATQQDIIYRTSLGQQTPGSYTGGYYNPFPQAPATQNICVSGVAMNVGHYNTTIYGGYVYLYFNGTQHGYALAF